MLAKPISPNLPRRHFFFSCFSLSFSSFCVTISEPLFSVTPAGSRIRRSGVAGVCALKPDVAGSCALKPGVAGPCPLKPGVAGSCALKPGVAGSCALKPGVAGSCALKPGVAGLCPLKPGVAGSCALKPGVAGSCALKPGVHVAGVCMLFFSCFSLSFSSFCVTISEPLFSVTPVGSRIRRSGVAGVCTLKGISVHQPLLKSCIEDCLTLTFCCSL